MDRSQKKITIGVVVAIIIALLVAFGVFNRKDTSKEDGASAAEREVVADPSFEDKEVQQKIDDFADGVEATEFENNSYTFDTDFGQTSISAEIPEDYPSDAPKLNAEIISAARSDSAEARKMFTVFWESNDSYEELEEVASEIVNNGWKKVNEDIFEDSEYIRFEKDDRRLDFSLADGEEGKREVMVMVEE
jgi:hypothetical protein